MTSIVIPQSLMETNDSHRTIELDRKQVNRASQALLIFDKRSREDSNSEETKATPLFGDERVVSLQIALKKIPKQANKKPLRVALKHPLYNRSGQDVVLITKDPEDEYAEKLQGHKLDCDISVVGIKRLKTEYHRYEARRNLRDSADLFLADKAILDMLPKLLGVTSSIAKNNRSRWSSSIVISRLIWR
eukprot:1063480_1